MFHFLQRCKQQYNNMNPLLGRLFENRSRSKSKPAQQEQNRRNRSTDRALVPKILAKVKLEALPQPQIDKRLSTLARSNLGKLPSLTMNNTLEVKENIRTRNNFRNRKLSTSIREMQANIFTTQLGQTLMVTEQVQPERMMVQIERKMVQIQSPQRKEEEDFGQGKQQEQLFEYLKVLENNQELNEEFCYMNRRSLPYSFYIVDYDDRNKEQYLTVSLRGITYFKEEQDEFYTIAKFSKEIDNFKRLKQISFFGDYLKVKVMKHWKDIMLRRKFNLKCRYIISHLFSQNRMIQQYLHFLHSLAQDYSGGSFFNFNISLTLSLESFSKVAHNGALEVIKSVRKFDALIQQTLTNTLQQMLTRFKTDERVTIGSQDRRKQDESYLPFDAKKRSMKYTQMAKLKQFQWMMYRLIKYTDMLRFNVKLQMIRKCYQNSIIELKRLKRASQNKETIRFTNWIEMTMSVEGTAGNATLVFAPGIQQVGYTMNDVKDHILKEIFQDHKLYIQSKDAFSCENLQLQQGQKPSKYDLKYYVQKQPEFAALKTQFDQALKEILNKMQQLANRSQQSLLNIYNKNALIEEVSHYLSNYALQKYLDVYRKDYELVVGFQDSIQFALVLVKVGVVRDHVRRMAQQRYKIIINAVPNDVMRRCDILQIKIRNVYAKFKENPHSVENYITFIKNFKAEWSRKSQLQQEMEGIIQFDELVSTHGIRMGQTAKLAIADVQKLMRQLTNRLQQIQQNQDKQRKKFEQMIDDMIPMIEQKSEDLLKDVKANELVNNYLTDATTAQKQIAEYLQSYEKLLSKKQEMFQYQRQLDLGHKQLQIYDKMQATIKSLDEVWKARIYYFKALNYTQNEGYGKINLLDLTPINQFLNKFNKYAANLQCFQLLDNFRLTTTELMKIIKMSQSLSAETLMPQHLHELKQIIKAEQGSLIKPQLLFTRQGKDTQTPQKIWKETNVIEITDQIDQIVFFSSQQSIVKSQLTQIQQFWKKNKVKLISEDLAQNQQSIMHLDRNQELHQKLGYFIVMLKNMEGSPHVVDQARERVVLNAKMCSYMRQLLWSWQNVEKQWISLLPVMYNCPAVKHQSNVFFQFTSVDNVIKKFIRTVSQMVSLRRICQDHHDRRFFGQLQEMDRQLHLIQKIFMSFLEMKRATYGRFCFMSDLELIQILQHAKDAITTSPFISYCFNARSLQFDGMLLAAFQHPNQIYSVRKIILKGEPDQIFRTIEENMRYSLKLMIKIMLPKLKISSDPYSISQEGTTQAILICDKLFWTELSQSYMNTMTYDQYKLLLKKQQQKIANYLKEASKQLWLQTAIRLTQSMHHREIGLELIRDQATPSDFKWKQQIRMYSTEQDLFVCHFDGKLPYWCQYRPPTNIFVPTNTSTRFLYESYRACHLGLTLLIEGGQGEGKQHLVEQASSTLGTYSRQIICSKRLSSQFLLKIVQGVVTAGAWASFYQFDNLNYQVCAELFASLNKLSVPDHRVASPFFMLVHHKRKVEQISIYSFASYAVIEPEKQRICEWLLQVNMFQNYQQLAQRIIQFLKITKPFLNKALGNQLGLIQQVVKRAGHNIKIIKAQEEQSEDPESLSEDKQQQKQEQNRILQLRAITEILRDEVVLKEEESKADCLNRALFACFGIEFAPDLSGERFEQKVQTLANLLVSGVSSIIVLGQRSCKSTAIKSALKQVNYSPIWLYPAATQVFFTPQVIDFLQISHNKGVFVYDGNDVLAEWTDLITAGFLFIESKKAVLSNQTIMQLRSIDRCSPSFVSKCQILYMGKKVVPKWNKILVIIPQNNCNYNCLRDVLIDLFGKNIQGIEEDSLRTIASLVFKAPSVISAKSMHRLVVWICALLGNEYLWTRTYGGEYLSFTLSGSYQLIPVQQLHFDPINYPGYKTYILVPTKTTNFFLSSISFLLQSKNHIHILGRPQSGKTSLMHFINKKYIFSQNFSTQQWSQSLKKKFTYVRREYHNWLIDFEKQGTRLVIDDLDMGQSSHTEYLRGLFEMSAFRDRNFVQYFLQKIQFIGFSRQCATNDKYWSHVAKLNLPHLQKQSAESIYRQNISRQIAEYNMNKQVQQLINKKIIKAAVITIDDLCNFIGISESSSLMLALLRNLLSLPKKQAYISADQYTMFFKTHFHSKLHERSQNSKLSWQIRSVQLNILKVIFAEQEIRDYSINLQGHYKIVNKGQLQELIKKMYPDMIVFDRLLETIVYLCNQIRCIDKNVVLLGRRGTGKRFILQISSKLAGVPIASTFSEAILAALRHQKTVFVEQLQDSDTSFQQLLLCQMDKQLQKFIQSQKRQSFYSILAGQNAQQGKIIERCRGHIAFTFICDDKESYQNFCGKFHEVYSMPVCLIEEWPAQAILNLFTINDPNPNLHADLFTKINAAMSQLKAPTFPLKAFQKYLKIFYQLFEKGQASISAQIKINYDIRKKFNESFELVSNWQARVDMLRIEIQQSITKSAENIVANQVSNMILSIFLDQIKEEEQISARQQSELKMMNRQIEIRLEFIKTTLLKIQKIVASFQRTELGQLKKIYKANNIVYFGVECLCVLLGQQDFEQKTINKILADPNLLMRMKAQDILDNRNSELEKKFKSQIQDLQDELEDSDSQLSKTIIQWIKNIISYWQACEKQRIQNEKYQKAKMALEQSSSKHTQLNGQANYIKKIIIQKLALVQYQLDFKRQKEIELSSIQMRLQNANIVIPILKRQQLKADEVIKELQVIQNNLRGNCILAAVTASFIPMQPIKIKQKLLQLGKSILRQNNIKLSQHFMAEITQQKTDSIQSLNYFLLEQCSLPKLVFDPQRKFLLFLQQNSTAEIRETVVQNSQQIKNLTQGKIYHTTGEYLGNKDDLLIVDWSTIAIEQKQIIFLKLAQYKRPQYFDVKKELQIKISRNLAKVQKLKQNLYQAVCEKDIKIIEDQQFIQLGNQLQKLQKETNNLKLQAEEKILQIKALTQQINEQVTKIVYINDHLKTYRIADLQLILDICCREGDSVQNLIKWCLANIKSQKWIPFLTSLVVSFNKEARLDILKDIINKTPLGEFQGSKIKKPALVSAKHWQIVLKLTNYYGNLKKLPQNIIKIQKQFQQWCIDPLALELPLGLFYQTIDFIEYLALLVHFKPNTYGYLAIQLIQAYLPYNIEPLSAKQIISMTNWRFPIMIHQNFQQIRKLCNDLNDGRYNQTRICKLGHQTQMKRVVWKNMQAKQWLICYDIQNKKDILMMESICYYVMNYDKHEGFRIIILVDHFQKGGSISLQQKLIEQSAFLSGICPYIYREWPSCDTLLQQNTNIEYQITNNQSFFTNKQVFNKMYRMSVICYSALCSRYPHLKVGYKRILQTLHYIKLRQITVEFNIFTIVNFLSRMMSHQMDDLDERRQIEQTWELIVDERKIIDNKLLGVPVESEKIDKYIRNNPQLIGCQHSHFVRLQNQRFQEALSQIYQLYHNQSTREELLAFIRLQLTRMPILITGKEMLNSSYSYFYNNEVDFHNKNLLKAKQMLEDLNNSNTKDEYLQTIQKSQSQKIANFIREFSEMARQSISINNLKSNFLNFVTRIRKQHDYLLYFNPDSPTVIIDPQMLNNIQLLISSHFINYLQTNGSTEAHKLVIYLDFCNVFDQKNIASGGMYISRLKCKEFNYNYQMKSIGHSMEVDGLEEAPLIKIGFREPKQVEGEEVEDLDMLISTSKGTAIFWGSVEYSTVYVEWGLRGGRLLVGSL